MKLNLPNKLSVLRLIMVPIFMVVMLIPPLFHLTGVPYMVLNLVGAALFIAASITDMLDGKIARKYNLITDFGKFLDPLADKFMVIGALMCILYNSTVNGTKYLSLIYFASLVIVVFRELAVTSIRLVASSSGGVVIAANKLGKIKTVMQIVAISSALIEPVLCMLLGLDKYYFIREFPPITVVASALMAVMTVISGINYIRGAWKYLDPEK